MIRVQWCLKQHNIIKKNIIPDIVFERLLRHPVTEVWEAITNAEKIILWSGGASAIDLRPGGKIRLGLLMATLEGIITGQENEKLLEYTLDAGKVPAFPVDGWTEISKEITEKYKTILPVS